MKPPYALMDAYFDGDITEQGVIELEAWLMASPAHPRLFARRSVLHGNLVRSMHMSELQRYLEITGLDQLESQSDTEPTQELWQTLVEIDRSAPADQLVELPPDALAARKVAAQAPPPPVVAPHDDRPQMLVNVGGFQVYRTTGNSGGLTVRKLMRVAAVLLLTALIGVMWMTRQPVPTIENVAATDDAIPARITRIFDARWSDGETPLTSGAELQEGRLYHLTHGLVELQMASSANVVVAAPARFEVTGANRLELLEGRLTADVPASARYFTVETPTAEVIDFGTEFNVHVTDAGASTTEVLTGKVQLYERPRGQTPNTPSRFVELAAGWAGQVSAHGKLDDEVRPVAVDHLSLRQELDARELARQGSRYHQWLVYSMNLRRDPDLVLYYPFDDSRRNGPLVINQARATYGRLNGQMGDSRIDLYAPTRRTGRWSRKGGVSLSRESEFRVSGIVVPHDPLLDIDGAMTIATWFRSTHDGGGGTVVSKRDSPLKEMNYQFSVFADGHLHGPRLQFGTGWESSDDVPGKFVYSPKTEPLEYGWHLAVVTVDGNTARFYLDGQLIHETITPSVLTPCGGDLLIGSDPYLMVESQRAREGFVGQMDELAIFRRALDADEIESMYRAGMPQ